MQLDLFRLNFRKSENIFSAFDTFAIFPQQSRFPINKSRIHRVEHRIKGLILLLLTIVFSSGCTYREVKSNAFDDLVNETNTTNSPLIEYRSFLSVSGLVPYSSPGTIFHHPDGLSPTHGISVSPKCSYIVSSDYEMAGSDEKNEAKIIELRDKYIDVRDNIFKSIGLQVQLSLASSALEKTSDPEFCQIAIDLLGGNQTDNCGDEDKKTLDALLARLKNDATRSINDVNVKKSELMKALSVKNVIIFQWSQKTELTWIGKFAEWLSFDITRSKDKVGVVIAGSLRTTSVKLGEDYLAMVQNTKKNGTDKLHKIAMIDLFKVEAKHIAYVDEVKLEEGIAAALDLTVEQLGDLKSMLGADEQLEFNLGAAALTEISNLGFFSSPSISERSRPFYPADKDESAARCEAKISDGYQVLYWITGRIKSLKMLDGVDVSDVTELNQCVPSNYKCPVINLN